MKEVKLLAVPIYDLIVLQNELHYYSQISILGYHHWGNEEFFNALLTVDQASRLWKKFRNKVESNKKKFTVTLQITEAVILLKCCCWQRHNRKDYDKFAADKYKRILEEALINLV